MFRRRKKEGEAQTVADDGIEPGRYRAAQIGPEAGTIEEPVAGRYDLPCMRIILVRALPETVDVTIRHSVDMQVEAGNALYQSSGKLTLPVGREGLVIGRSRQSDIQVLDEYVSRVHARLSFRPEGYLEVRDLGSSNGTRILWPFQHLGSGERGVLNENSRIRLGNGGPDLDISYRL